MSHPSVPPQNNPYASPAMESQTTDFGQGPGIEGRIATQGQRLINLLLDNILLQVLSIPVGVVLGLVFAAKSLSTGSELEAGDEFMLNIIGYILGVMVALAYFIICEAASQKTLGKLVSGTMVVTTTGGKPSVGQIVGRAFARMIPFEAFSFLGSNNPVGWHDSLSGTRVISIKKN